MSLILWIVIGGLAGWLGSLVTGDDENMGIVSNVVVGIVGAFIGGFLVSLLGRGDGISFTNAITGFNFTSILISTVGAVVLIAVMKALRTNPA